MLFPFVRFPKKQQNGRRQSAFSHKDVNECNVLSRPLLPLDRMSSPTALIDVAGHPRLAPVVLKPSVRKNDSPKTPIPTDKTLIDNPHPRVTTIHYSETLYDKETTTTRRRRSELDRLLQHYDKEQMEWQERLEEYERREADLMAQLVQTRAKLDQLQGLSDRTVHHHHHHHYYYMHKLSEY